MERMNHCHDCGRLVGHEGIRSTVHRTLCPVCYAEMLATWRVEYFHVNGAFLPDPLALHARIEAERKSHGGQPRREKLLGPPLPGTIIHKPPARRSKSPRKEVAG
jgi:hypothetical protein